MLTTKIQCCSIGTRCITLMTHIRRHITYKSSLCCVSLTLNTSVPAHHTSTYETTREATGLFKSCKAAAKSYAPYQGFPVFANNYCPSIFVLRSCSFSTNGNKPSEDLKPAEPKKLSVFQKFKQMYRDYWYVLVPVHIVTSLGWFTGFYYMAKSGVDVIALLESLNISEKLINPLRDSKAGYIALAYALYKIATPVRYTVTLGGTTISIKYLKEWGYIKPIPGREKLREMYNEKKELYQEELKLKQQKLKKTGENMIRGYSKPNK